jgi:hypothetical protein
MPVNDSAPKSSIRQPWMLFAAPALLTAVLITAAILRLDQPWGVPALVVGLVCGGFLGVMFILQHWVVGVYGMFMLFSAALLAVGALMTPNDPIVALSGVLGLIILGSTLPLAWRSSPRGGDAAGGAEAGTLTAVQEALARLDEHVILSDHAKRVLFRERELGLLRQAIETDIAHGKYNAALALCEEMAGVFGYREEAEAYRQQIMQISRERRDQEVHAAVAGLDHHLAARDWRSAYEESARIKRLYPEAHVDLQLDQRIAQARDTHKQELEAKLLDAAQRDDTEQAMVILRQLDRYMTREEAARLSEVAARIIEQHRETLSTSFRMAVNDKRWAEASSLGDRIIAEFPNSKMADEVRSMLDVIRTRATQSAVEEASY